MVSLPFSSPPVLLLLFFFASSFLSLSSPPPHPTFPFLFLWDCVQPTLLWSWFMTPNANPCKDYVKYLDLGADVWICSISATVERWKIFCVIHNLPVDSQKQPPPPPKTTIWWFRKECRAMKRDKTSARSVFQGLCLPFCLNFLFSCIVPLWGFFEKNLENFCFLSPVHLFLKGRA